MKKILLILTIMSVNLQAQSPATVTIQLIAQDTVAPGDSVDVYFSYTPPFPSNNSKNQFWLTDSKNAQYKLWEDNYEEFASMKWGTVNSTTCNIIRLGVPIASAEGEARVSSTQLPMQYKTVEIKKTPVDTTGGNDTTGGDSTDVGIFEWHIKHPVHYSELFDPYQREVQPQAHQILIKHQEGTRPRKILITN